MIVSVGQLFKTFNLDQNDDPFFPIQDQVIHLTFMPVFQSNIGLDITEYNVIVTLKT